MTRINGAGLVSAATDSMARNKFIIDNGEPFSRNPNAAVDPLRPVFEAVSAATSPLAKFEALKTTAAQLATPIRHGLLDYYEIEECLIDLARSQGLVDELTLGAVEVAVVTAIKTPALADHNNSKIKANGQAADTRPLSEQRTASTNKQSLKLTFYRDFGKSREQAMAR